MDDNETAERAYDIWAGDADQSLKRTSEIANIPLRTVQYYASTRDWQQRHLAQMTPEAERSALLARNRMRLRLPEIEAELYFLICGKQPMRAPDGSTLVAPDGTPMVEYHAEPRDRAYAIKLYLEYAMARLMPEETAGAGAHTTPKPALAQEMNLSQAASAIIDAHVHDIGGDQRKVKRHRVNR